MYMKPAPITESVSTAAPAFLGGMMSQDDGIRSVRGSRGLRGFALTDGETRTLIDLIYRNSGIVLTPEKKSLISSRLHKRLKILGFYSFREYLDYLQYGQDGGAELVAMIDEITTNKTSFFRERHHFDYLTSTILPSIATSDWTALNIWSAGCSTGEEPYTLAMVLAEYFGTTRNFTIHATDLSTQALHAARQAVYDNELGAPIPLGFRQKYTLTGYGSQAGRFRIVPELRERVTFSQVNLIKRNWEVADDLDIIFCRNVMIYFDKPTRRDIVSGFTRKLKSDGHLFIGHSETLGDIDHRFSQVKPTIYTRQG